jgi:hypothetical protein
MRKKSARLSRGIFPIMPDAIVHRWRKARYQLKFLMRQVQLRTFLKILRTIPPFTSYLNQLPCPKPKASFGDPEVLV